MFTVKRECITEFVDISFVPIRPLVRFCYAVPGLVVDRSDRCRLSIYFHILFEWTFNRARSTGSGAVLSRTRSSGCGLRRPRGAPTVLHRIKAFTFSFCPCVVPVATARSLQVGAPRTYRVFISAGLAETVLLGWRRPSSLLRRLGTVTMSILRWMVVRRFGSYDGYGRVCRVNKRQ